MDAFEERLNGNFNGDIAHLITRDNEGNGGLAYVDVLCNSNLAVAYSNIGSNYSNFPNYSWTVEVFTHEMGHNLGSPHTHNCSWSGGPIDNCYTPEGNCSSGPTPTNGGTIMSYCHLSSIGINFENGFGPLPGNKIRAEVSNALCLGPGGPMPNLTKLSDSYSLDGTTIQISHRVINSGDANAANHTVNYYFSTNTSITTNDILLGTRSISSLEARTSSSTINFSVDYTSLSLSQGTYYVGYIIDPTAAVLEGNEADNAFYWISNPVDILGYCEAKGNNTTYEWIEKVTIGDFSHTSGNNSGYNHFENLNCNLTKGIDLNLNLETKYSGTPYPEYWRIWIDLNQDFDFDDAGELVFDGGNAISNAIAGTMMIPNSAMLGGTRMRLSMKWIDTNDSPPTNCEAFTYGEVEDYNVNIVEDSETGGNNNNLPIELLNFSAEIQLQSNLLKWTTASEENTLYHIVERSIDDGKTFETLEKVAATGSVHTNTFYQWEDKNPALVSYYRLQTVDTDGSFYFSNIIQLKRQNKEDWTFDPLFPNPAYENIHLSFNAPQSSAVQIQIIDVMGTIWQNQQWQAKEGQNQFILDVKDLATGIYFVVLENPKERKIKRISKK